MTTCIRCHRPLKAPTATGMGEVCARKSREVPVPAHERDLFGYDLEKAVNAARYRLRVQIEGEAAEVLMAVRHGFRDARVALGVWS